MVRRPNNRHRAPTLETVSCGVQVSPSLPRTRCRNAFGLGHQVGKLHGHPNCGLSTTVQARVCSCRTLVFTLRPPFSVTRTRVEFNTVLLEGEIVFLDNWVLVRSFAAPPSFRWSRLVSRNHRADSCVATRRSMPATPTRYPANTGSTMVFSSDFRADIISGLSLFLCGPSCNLRGGTGSISHVRFAPSRLMGSR